MKSDIDEFFNCQNIFLNKNDIIFEDLKLLRFINVENDL